VHTVVNLEAVILRSLI